MKTQLNNESKEIHLKVSCFRVKTEISYENQGTTTYPCPVPIHKEEEYIFVKSIDVFIDNRSRLDIVEEKIIDEISDEEVDCFSFESVSSDFVDALKEMPFIRAMMR